MLERFVDWLDLSRAEGPYIYRLDSHIHIHIPLHIYIRLHIRLRWYEPLYTDEPLSWGISSYTNYILNGPEAHDAGTHATFVLRMWSGGSLLYYLREKLGLYIHEGLELYGSLWKLTIANASGSGE